MIRNSRILLAATGLALAIGLMPGAVIGVATAAGSGSDHDHEHGEATSQQTEHSHDKATLHGGQVTAIEDLHFETVFAEDGVRVFFYTANQAPMMVKKATGTATLTFENGPEIALELVRAEPKEGDPAVHFCPMHEEVVQSKTGLCTHCGGMKLFVQDYLYAKADLSKVKPGAMKAALEIEGLKGKKEALSFTEVYGKPKTEEASSKKS